MNPAVKAVLFDVDGTLLETSEGILSSVFFALKQNGLSLPEGFNHDNLIGPPIQDSFKKLFPSLSVDELASLTNEFRNHYKDEDLLKAKVYPGINESIAALKEAGIKIGIATYKREDYAVRIVKHFGLDKYASCIHGQDMEGKMRKKDIIALCLKEMGVAPEEAIMVGDANSDYVGAMDNGMRFLAVTYGYGFKSEADLNEKECIGVAKDGNEIWRILL